MSIERGEATGRRRRLHALIQLAHVAREARLVVLDAAGVDAAEHARHAMLFVHLAARVDGEHDPVATKAL